MKILLAAFAFLIIVSSARVTAQSQQCTPQTCQCTPKTCPWLTADLQKTDKTAAFCGGQMVAIVDLGLGGLSSIGFDVTDDSPEAINRKLLYPFVTVNKCPCPQGMDFHDVLVVQGLSGCTSVAGVQLGTVQALLDFTAEFGLAQDHASAKMVISGGSESGHEVDDAVLRNPDLLSQPLTHGNGFKVDVVDRDPNIPAVDGGPTGYEIGPLNQFIFDHFSHDRQRGDMCDAYGDTFAVNPLPFFAGIDFGPEFALEDSSCKPSGEHWDLAFPPLDFSRANLALQFPGSGGGGVTSEFIDCIANCSTPLTRFIKVNLSAIPDANSVFSGWTGVDSRDIQNGSAVFVFLDTDRTIGAVFYPNTPPPGNPGCWAPVATGFLWVCTSPPPQNGGTPPPSGTGCWHWNPSVGPQGAWLFSVCGGTSRGGTSSITVTGTTSHDPNEKLGSQGIGTQQYLQRNQALRYAVFFSNQETATASAQEITVTDQLDLAKVEFASFSLGPVTFGNILVSPPVGASTFTRIVDLRPGNNLLVKVEASLDSSTGLLTWRFTSLDPATGRPPLDPSAGFLPPGGEGSVFFTVLPKAGTPTNTQINNQATIVFDTNAPIPTQTWFNTIDNEKPVSHVLVLPAQSPTTIPLQWAGSDVGAGVQDFTVYVSDNGGPFAPFVTQSTATSAAFAGQPGHTYDFFSTARDFVGNVEDLKTIAEATTTVVTDAIPPTTIAVVAPPANGNGWNNSNVSISLSSTDNPGGSGVEQITFNATGGQSIPSTNVSGNSVIATIGSEGVTNLSFFATDFAGNVELAHTLPIRIDRTPPSITGSRTPSSNANGWSNTDVTVSFACSDGLSGLAPGSLPDKTLISSEGVNQQVSGVCQDLAGNTTSATVSGINVDKTPPTIAPLRAPAANANGWNNSDVTVSFACTDALSGLAPGSPPAATVLSEGTNQQVSGTCFDLAVNAASATAGGINIDKTPPALSGLPAANCILWPPDHKFVAVATISAADLLSGISSFSVTGTSSEPMDPNNPDIIITGSGLGPRTVQLRADRLGTANGRIYTITSTATDAAGNVVKADSTCAVPHDQAP